MRDTTVDVLTPTPARVWGDQWLRVSEKVLKGLNHQLSNRVASIEAVTSLLEPGDGADTKLTAALLAEVERLSTLVPLYRLLPAEPRADPEPVRLQDVLPHVLDLHLYHSDLRGVACELAPGCDADPVLVRPSALMRSLLVLLESAAGNIYRSGEPGVIRLAFGGDAERSRLTLEAPFPAGQEVFTGVGSLVHAVRDALAHADAVVEASREVHDGAATLRYELVLPTLSVARRRESAMGNGQ